MRCSTQPHPLATSRSSELNPLRPTTFCKVLRPLASLCKTNQWAKRDSNTPTISRGRGGCVPEVAYRVAYRPPANDGGRGHGPTASEAAVPAGEGARWRHAAAHAAVTVTVRGWSNSRWLLGLMDGAAKD